MLAFNFGSLYSTQQKNAIQLRQAVDLIEGFVEWGYVSGPVESPL